MSKRDAAIYREAARQFAQGCARDLYSCWTVAHLDKGEINNYYESPLAVRYYETMSPDGTAKTFTAKVSQLFDERDDFRVLALCLMAAMAEAGDA